MRWIWLVLFAGLAAQAAVTFVGGSVGRALAFVAGLVLAFVLA